MERTTRGILSLDSAGETLRSFEEIDFIPGDGDRTLATKDNEKTNRVKIPFRSLDIQRCGKITI